MITELKREIIEMVRSERSFSFVRGYIYGLWKYGIINKDQFSYLSDFVRAAYDM